MLELTRLKGLAYSALLLAVKQNKNRIKCLIDELTYLWHRLQYLTTVVWRILETYASTGIGLSTYAKSVIGLIQSPVAPKWHHFHFWPCACKIRHASISMSMLVKNNHGYMDEFTFFFVAFPSIHPSIHGYKKVNSRLSMQNAAKRIISQNCSKLFKDQCRSATFDMLPCRLLPPKVMSSDATQMSLICHGEQFRRQRRRRLVLWRIRRWWSASRHRARISPIKVDDDLLRYSKAQRGTLDAIKWSAGQCHDHNEPSLEN